MNVRFRREKGFLIIPRSVEKHLFVRAFEADFASEPSKPTGGLSSEADQARTYQKSASRSCVPAGDIPRKGNKAVAPIIELPTGIRTNHDADAEEKCGEWLTERVREWREAGG